MESNALHGNPFDDHTLKEAIEQTEGLSGTRIDKVFVDKGYRGHGVTTCQVISSYSKCKLNWKQRKTSRDAKPSNLILGI